MFNKTKPTRAQQPEAAVAPPLDINSVNMNSSKSTPMAATAPKVGSVLSSTLIIEGNITGSGDLHLEGTVRGDVKAGHLVVGEAGNVEGSIEAETIEIRGRVVGGISGKQVRLSATAYVEGDITHEQLSIDVGAYFVGRCLQSRARPETVHTAPAPAQPAAAQYATTPDYGTPSLSSYDMNALSDLKPSY
jgi:cytoskeletal protein CcmA (bactofilin family)